MGPKKLMGSTKIDLFNDIHGDSGGYLQEISNISLQRRLATVGLTGTNGIQSHSPTQSFSKQAANDIHTIRWYLWETWSG